MEILDAAGFEIQQICEKTSTERLGISYSIESAILLIRTMYIYIRLTCIFLPEKRLQFFILIV